MSAVLFQVRDLAAATCGEPHVAPSWLIAQRSLGAMLAKTPELAKRAGSIKIERITNWDPSLGIDPCLYDPDQDCNFKLGDECLKDFLEACRKEEEQGGSEPDKFFTDLPDGVEV